MLYFNCTYRLLAIVLQLERWPLDVEVSGSVLGKAWVLMLKELLCYVIVDFNDN